MDQAALGEHNATQLKAPSVLDLFAAPGGLSQGFKDAGFRIAAQVDNDRWGCETLSDNFCHDGTILVQASIEKVIVRANVDVVVGGPPCQSFSHVGRAKINHLRRTEKRRRFIDYNRNRLYRHFVKIVEAVKPQFFVMENVPGMVSFNSGLIKNQIVEDFERIRYDVDVRILSAADYGVPQIRRRAIFIGNRIGAKNPFPEPTHYEASTDGMAPSSSSEVPRYVSVFDAISDLPPLEPRTGQDEMEYPIPITLTPYQKWAREGSNKLFNHVARFHNERDRQIFRGLDPGERMIDLPEQFRPYRSDIFADKIKKQSWNFPSTAIVAHMQKDGLMYVHPDGEQARTSTAREAARIQSFRDRYRFLGPMTQQYKQIGNAVPPLLAQSIALAIKPRIEPVRKPTVRYEMLIA